MAASSPELLPTLNRFAEVLQTEKKPWDILRELAELVRDYTRAEHAKVLVVQRELGRPGLEQLCRTDDPVSFARKVVPITEVGLSNWVVTHQKWLVVPVVPSEWPVKTTVLFPVLAGRAGEGEVESFEVRAEHEIRFKSSEAIDSESRGDDEHTMLLVPLGGEEGAAGVLALWRNRAEPGQSNPTSFVAADTVAVLDVAPFLSAACQLVLQQRALADELEAVKELSKGLHEAKRLGAAYQAIAAGVGRLGGAAHALLLHPDPDRPGHLYHRATWSAEGQDSRVATKLQGLHVHIPEEGKTRWKEAACEQIQRILDELPRTRLIVSPSRVLAAHENNPGEMVALFLDRDSSLLRRRYFASHRSHEVGRSFLGSASAMLPKHLQTYAYQLLEELGTAETTSDSGPDQLLEKAAELLHGATGASATLVYSGPATKLQIASATPKNPRLVGRDIGATSLTQRCVEEKKPIRVVDTGDPTDERVSKLDHQRLEETRTSYGWKRIRSWMVTPVLDRGRCVGVLKLLTADRDGFLGRDHEELALKLAERAAWEIRKLNRRLQLEALNKLANDLTQARGSALGKRIVENLEVWAATYLRPGVEIALLTRISPDRRLIDATSASISDDQAVALRQLSKQLNSTKGKYEPGASIHLLEDGTLHLEKALVAFPIELPGKRTLQGHLMFLHFKAFTDEEREAAQEATREIGIVLHSERLNRFWQEQAGRFRHAVIGPVQGLQSTSLDLVAHLEEIDLTAEGKAERGELHNQILKECELIRIWRTNERLYTTEKVEIRTRYQPFKDVFDRCLKRAEPLFVDREVRLRPFWRPYGQAHFTFDDKGLDLVLSNLLENARKYAYKDTEVTVGLMTTADEVLLWVEDVGHPIPDALGDRIYEIDARLDWEDPFRTIEGQGLGLPMAKAIVTAHGGTITHQSTKDLEGRRPETTRYRVRFTVKLPVTPRR